MTSSDWASQVESELPSAGDGFDFPSTEYGFDDLDAGGVDADKIGSGSLRVEKKGWYLFRIEATAKPKPHHDDDMTKKRSPSIGLRMIVEASENGTPAGATHYHDLICGGYGGGPMEDWQRDQTLNFLVGAGICKKDGDKIIDPATGTTKVQTSTLATRLNGLRVFGKLELTAARPKLDKEKKPVLDANDKPVMYAERIEFPFGRGVYPIGCKEVAHLRFADEALKPKS